MKIFTEKASKRLIWIGVVLIIVGLISFQIGEKFFDFKSEIKSDKIGQLGDFFGGVIGSIWALAGVILFYVALKRQTDALKDQRESTKATVESLRIQSEELKLQSKELQLQREELHQTREEFKINRLTNILFKQIEHVNSIISGFKFFSQFVGEPLSRQLSIEMIVYRIEGLEYENLTIEIHNLIDLNSSKIISLLTSVHSSFESFEKLLKKSSIEKQEMNQLKSLFKGNVKQEFFSLLRYRVKFIRVESKKSTPKPDLDMQEIFDGLIKLELLRMNYLLEYTTEDNDL
jgi:hypothetical protein